MPVVRAWEDGLVQVFQNLLENALKYRRDDVAPQISIEAVQIAGMWEFRITDNGIGFDVEYSDKVFRVFQRLHGRSEYSGNGIGLAITKRVVERHGGRIWVGWSEPGKGTQFCFTLPVLAHERKAAAAE
jgi:light-regulated signal transduction histidine kinase (bacteriophytochrome)